MPWTPILSGADADAATAVVREIAVGLAAVPAAPAADRALFWAYASPVLDDRGLSPGGSAAEGRRGVIDDRGLSPGGSAAEGRRGVIDDRNAHAAYAAALDELIAELHRGTPHLGLYGGLADAGWTLAHVLDAGDDLVAIDDVLLAALARWSGADDLIEGLVGIGVYFLERGVAAGVAAVAAQLARTAIATADGATWHTPLAILPPSFAATHPDGFYDCGLAHGVPGIAAFLARAGSPLARDAARWVETQACAGRFPSKISSRVDDRGLSPGAEGRRGVIEPARTAWCYGDPGVAIGLWQTSPELAHATARAAAGRTETVTDAGLCHGAAGLAHVYNRCFHASGDAAFADAARAAYAQALALPRPADAGFLEGAAGLGLALLAATTTTEPAWDRRLLCDLPPKG